MKTKARIEILEYCRGRASSGMDRSRSALCGLESQGKD